MAVQREIMAKGSRRSEIASSVSSKPAGRRPRPDIIHSTVYLPLPIHEALREAAFHERCKIHDLIMEGIGLALRKRGFPPIEDLKAGKRR
jgi:hypothetical protein